ncbi:unnamed protein product, partial [marine sediment metagenome]
GLYKRYMRLIPLSVQSVGGDMKVIAFIEDYRIVKKILDYLGIY